MKDKLRLLIALIAIVMLFPAPAMAATSASVTVNATPGFLEMVVAPLSWEINSLTGTGIVAVNGTYYSNPLGDGLVPSDPIVDGECRFTLTNTATVATNLTVNWSNFAGGDASVNSDTGSNAAASFGGYAWNSGDSIYATNRTVSATAGSDYMHSNLAGLTNIKFGLTGWMQTNAWTSGTTMTSSVTVTMTQAY